MFIKMEEINKRIEELRREFIGKLKEQEETIKNLESKVDKLIVQLEYEIEDSSSETIYSTSSCDDKIFIRPRRMMTKEGVIKNPLKRIVSMDFRNFIEKNYLFLKDYEKDLIIDDLIYDERGALIINVQTAINLIISYTKFNNLRDGKEFTVDDKLCNIFDEEKVNYFFIEAELDKHWEDFSD